LHLTKLVNKCDAKTFYLSCFKVYNSYELVIKYIEFIRIFIYEDSLPKITDIDALKCRYQLGLETLLAYTFNNEY